MSRDRPAFVYFVRRADGEGPVKIGCSDCPPDRLSTLMTWAPYPLALVTYLPGDEKLEMRFHTLFADSHSHREWFHPSAALDAVMAQVAAGTFDIATLPEGKRLPSQKHPGWREFTKAKLHATRGVERLCKVGFEVPLDVVRCANAMWYKVSMPEMERRVAVMQAFLATVPAETQRAAKAKTVRPHYRRAA